MSITETAAAVVAAMRGFTSAYKAARSRKVTNAALADNANKLNDATLAEVIISAESSLAEHKSTKAVHHVQSANIADTKEVFDEQISGMIPLSAVPFSRYGDAGSIPVEVSGSYEGATGYYATRWMAVNIEDDGTMVFLRNGTDGGAVGVYYAYSSNVLELAQTYPVRTTRRYSPAFYPSNIKAVAVHKGTEGIIVCRVLDSVTNDYHYSISKTNGTFDDKAHDGCFVTIPNWPAAYRGSVEPVIVGEYLYFFTGYITQDATDGFLIKVHRLPLASITGGQFLIPEVVSDWTTYGLNQMYTHTHIKPAGTGWSADIATDPLIHIVNSANSGGEQFMDCGMWTFIGALPDGRVRILCCGDMWWVNGSTNAAIRPFMALSLVVDLNTRTAEVDEGQRHAVLDQHPNGSPYFSDVGTLYKRSGNEVQGYFPGGNNYTSFYYHEKSRTLIHLTDVNIVDNGYWISAYRFTSASDSKFEAARFDRVIEAGNLVGFSPKYGSAIGGLISGAFMLPNNNLVLFCSGADSRGTTQRTYARAVLSGTYNEYTYTSLTHGTLRGYKPSPSRQFLYELGVNIPYGTPMIAVSGLGSDVRLYGTAFHQGGPQQTFFQKDENMVDVGESFTPTISDDVYRSCRGQILSLIGLDVNSIAESFLSIFIMPEAIQHHCLFFIRTNAKRVSIYLANITSVTGSITGTVTGVTIGNVSPEAVMHTNAYGLWFDSTATWYGGPQHVFKGNGGYYVGGFSRYACSWPGNGSGFRYRFYAYPSGAIDLTSLVCSLNYTYSPQGYIAIPGVGFGGLCCEVDYCDNQTKAIFWKYVDSRLGLINGDVESTTVLQGQQVAAGWGVFFTGSVPVLMNGKYGDVPPTTVLLTDIATDPSNSVFYVYVIEASGVFSYLVTKDLLEDTLSRMYVGVIKTGSTSINSIVVDKISRISTYRPALTGVGSSFPVLAGPVTDVSDNQSGNLTW